MSLVGRLVGVRWRDAHADATRQMGPEEIALARSYVFTSYGILVRDDRDEGGPKTKDPLIAVAHEQGEDGIFRGITFVPLEMMVEVIDLGSPSPKRKRSRKGEGHQSPVPDAQI